MTSLTALAAGYVEALMDAFAPDSAAGRKLAEWLREHRELVGIDFDAAISRTPSGRRRRRSTPTDRPLSAQSWLRLRAQLARQAGMGEPNNLVATNITALAGAVGLEALETEILAFVLVTDRDVKFNELCNQIIDTRSVDAIGLIATTLRRARKDIDARLTRGLLVSLQLVDIYGDLDRRLNLQVTHRVQNASLPPSHGLADIERRLIGEPLKPAAGSLDFSQIAPVEDFVRRLLLGALDAGSTGVNILVYGPPGAGKTEFCKSIVQQVGGTLFAVGETDEDDDEPSRGERVEALRLAERLAGRRGRALLLFDEMEDILQHGEHASFGGARGRRAGSKVFFNRLLERNRVPVLWTANAIDEFDPAFIRRMTFAFEMKPLPSAGRARLWRQRAEAEGIALAADQAVALAQRHQVAPSVIAGATRAVALAKGDAGDMEFVAGRMARAIHGVPRRAAEVPAGFVPELVNADCDLAALREALARPGAARDVSMCLYGPPGTGKSAFVRSLAHAMGLDVLLVRGSDLLSKWVGGTEQRIAAAFSEAVAEQRFLVIDEAEALLWGRGGASVSWEVSMVNELLSAMESHPLPFACTTNHLETIDPAALRRFTFKVKLDFMTPAQSGAAYRRFFDRDAPAALRELTALTPGDFAVVAKKLRVVGDAESDSAILRLLEQEVAVKKLPLQRIGF
jgi:transitional endoplasmic reticulum ATPase